ncbi:MAG: DUF456 domain-containing protein [Anaerolineaceae bacterium]|jgi:hypothetical protein
MNIDWNAILQVAFPALILLSMLLGLFSLLLVVVPGLTIIWVSALVYGIVEGFGTWGWVIFAVMTIQMVIGSISDNFLMGINARSTGASWLAIGVAVVGGIVGSLVFPPFGGILAALLGIFIVELIRIKDLKQAWVSLKGMATGCSAAVVLRFAMGIGMIILWCIWAFVVN